MSNTPDNFIWTDELVAEYSLASQTLTLWEFKRRKASHTVREEVGWEVVRVRNKFHNTDKTFDLEEYEGRKIINGQNYNFVVNCIDRKYTIEAVRRKSDGELFTVNDISTHGKIVKFEIIGNHAMYATYEIDNAPFSTITFGQTPLISLHKAPKEPVKEVLFTTFDGVNIHEEGTETWLVKEPSFSCNKYPFHRMYGNAPEWKLFYVESAAREYVTMNKPCLSVNDLLKLKKETGELVTKGKLIEFAKSKTNQ